MSNEGFRHGPKKRSPYDLLGVSLTSTPEEIKKAYRKRAMETHPDTGGSAEAFREVSDAYEKIMNSPAKQTIHNRRNPYAKGEPSRGSRSDSHEERSEKSNRDKNTRNQSETGKRQERKESPEEAHHQSAETSLVKKIELYREAIHVADTMEALDSLRRSIAFDAAFGYKKTEKDAQEELLEQVRRRKVDGYKQLIQKAGSMEALDSLRRSIAFDLIFGYKQDEKREQNELLEEVKKRSKNS